MLDRVPSSFLWDVLRIVFSFLDRIVYWGIDVIYELFFRVVKYDGLFPGETFQRLFDRVFLILGFFMLFRLAFSLLNAIINPDMLTNKDKGLGKIVSRVIIVLMLLISLMPLNIPDAQKGSFEEQLNKHGLLFGTLYTAQNMILEQNILGKLILNQQTTNVENQDKNIMNAGTKMSKQILKAFIYPNPECGNVIKEESWNRDDTTPKEILDNINVQCGDSNLYSYSYIPLVSTIAGGIILITILGFTLDIAIRTIKLILLRLIAPIPVISYVDPKSAKDGAFSAWTKMLTSTFLDVFLRLMIVYFIVFLVSELLKKFPIYDKTGNYVVDAIVMVVIIIGLFFFAKQAPKFFKDMLGIKGTGSGVGIGLNGILAAAGVLIGRGGFKAAGAAMLDTMDATNEAIATGKQAPSGYRVGSDFAAKMRTGDANAKGGILNNWDQKLRRSAANAHGLKKAYAEYENAGSAVKNYDSFIRATTDSMQLESANLVNLRINETQNQSSLANVKSHLQNNYAETLRNKVNSIRQTIPNATNADILTDARQHGWASDGELYSYFADESQISILQGALSNLETQIQDSERKIAQYQNEIANANADKEKALRDKSDAKQHVTDLERSHGVIGGLASKYGRRYNGVSGGPPTGPPPGP